jgi:SAM-dependent methyltransferase
MDKSKVIIDLGCGNNKIPVAIGSARLEENTDFDTVLKICARELPRGVMLDFGCGDGHNMKYFKDYGWRCVGIDIDKKSLEKAKQYGKVYLRITKRLPFEDASFDFILSKDVFHHLYDENYDIQEISRCLKKGGLIHEVVENNFFIRLGRSLHPKYKNMPVLSRFTTEELVDLLEKNNLEIICIYEKKFWKWVIESTVFQIGFLRKLYKPKNTFIRYFPNRIKKQIFGTPHIFCLVKKGGKV